MWLFVIFVAVPIIEIGLFIQVGGWLGLWPTLAIVVLTAFLGTVLVRSQGIAAMGNIKSNLNEFRDPTESLAHGAMILVSGILLLTPGFFTDAAGFALLVPPIRLAIFHAIKSRLKVQSFVQTDPMSQQRYDQSDTIIDGEYTELDDDGDTPSNRPPSGWTRH
jgi:UPF0716 protein FxsA